MKDVFEKCKNHFKKGIHNGNSIELTCRRPSKDLGRVTHLLATPGLLNAFSKSSKAPFFFLSFFTKLSTAFSAHFSSSSPCFHPSNLLTAGLVKENKLFKLLIGEDIPIPLNSLCCCLKNYSEYCTSMTLKQSIRKGCLNFCDTFEMLSFSRKNNYTD